MNYSEEFGSEIEDFNKSGQITAATIDQQSGSIQPSSASEGSAMSTCEESEAVYYFGYGPIVNPIVRYRRGCKIPPENIKIAILYDHRLQFVPGGTANIVATRGWDVKGVLLRFNPEEWEEFRQYDANYDVREISVSVIDKTNLDPKNKNDHTAPFEEDDNEDLDDSERSGPLLRSRRMHQSMLVSGSRGSSSLNSLEGNSSEEEEDYSCPFSFEPKSKKADPNAVKCFTFAIDQAKGTPRHVISENKPYQNGTIDTVVGKPQERYLKLMTDGLRAHEIDETYIHDEVLAVSYIPNERDKVTDQVSYRSFPNAKKVSKISHSKYEKLCFPPKEKDNGTHFLIGSKIIRVDDGSMNNMQNPVVRWLREQAHGQGDVTLTVQETFVDKDCLHLEPVRNILDVTKQHHTWAEHIVLLYLERGGLTASVIGGLIHDEGGKSLKDRFMRSSNVGKRIMGRNKSHRSSFPQSDLAASMSELHTDGSQSASFRHSAPSSTPSLFGSSHKRTGIGKKLFKKK